MSDFTVSYIIEKLNISKSYLYKITKNSDFDTFRDSNNRIKWNNEVINQVNSILVSKKKKTEVPVAKYQTTLINNRRYLGNKYKLLPFIQDIVENNCDNINTFADIFSGTGAVASGFLSKKLITNDLMYSNYICHVAFFSSEAYSKQKIISYVEKFNNIDETKDNYMTKNFSNTFFSHNDCSKIGVIRESIEKEYKKQKINFRERALLITSLLYAMDKIANTCGHYDAYRKKGSYDKELILSVPLPVDNINENNICYNMDANQLVKEIEADIVYIDPPYNSRQYCDAYHVLENVAKWEKPEVYGVARKMDRTQLKSDYCTKNATQAFEDLVENINAKYILLSYNNMADKGNDRSNAKISDEDILRILSAKGTVEVFSQEYKAFSTGKSDTKDNEERLFLCTCFPRDQKFISSPLNYVGGKYRLLNQIIPCFPNDITQFVDLFSGGCNVGINSSTRKVIFNDISESVIGLLKTLQQHDKKYVLDKVDKIISKYKLSNTSKHGYEHYGVNSSNGVASYNKDKFLKLRNDFNKMKQEHKDYYIFLFTLILFSFNNQIRFNSHGEFNLPVGKRDFNSKMRNKLELFIDKVKSCDYTFMNDDFRNIDYNDFDEGAFVYIDPPYLITNAPYNENNGWNEADEIELLRYIDELDANGIRFALSNVITNKGKTNEILLNWINDNQNRYNVIRLNYNYSNSNYQISKESKEYITEEVLIVNY